jgi:hypothetical protein
MPDSVYLCNLFRKWPNSKMHPYINHDVSSDHANTCLRRQTARPDALREKRPASFMLTLGQQASQAPSHHHSMRFYLPHRTL